MDGSEDFESLQESISFALVNTTRVAGQVYSKDITFHRSLNPAVAATLDRQNARLLDLAGSLLRVATSGSNIEAPYLKDVDDIDNSWCGLVEVVDSLLERADTSLDEYTGVIKKLTLAEEAAAVSWPFHKSNQSTGPGTNDNLIKPQLLFRRQPLNDMSTPFRPLLIRKPHAILPLDESLSAFKDDYGNEQFKHPYETEITQFQYPTSVYTKSSPILFTPFETTTATWVDTPEAVASMLAELKTAKEIAVDLEHHDARSYIGLVSLMQISTRDKDWIVDTLRPWREELQVLNEVFADPSIVKVFHGAYMDIVWLQRDLGIYVVGLFDTFHAASALGYTGHSLAFLLKKFVNFDANKQYQLADWRIRPLTTEMFKYARADTHFLLYIYDHVRNELIDKSNPRDPDLNRIENVLLRSKETSLLRFETDIYDPISGMNATGWFHMLRKGSMDFTSEQLAVFKAVHQWRDKTARQMDESLNFVMPKNFLFTIAKKMPLDVQSLLSSSRHVTPPIRSRASELVGIIRKAKAEANTETKGLNESTKKSGAMEVDIPHTQNMSAAKSAEGHGPITLPDSISIFEVAARAENARAERSQFWGPIFGSSLWNPLKAASLVNEGIHLALPLPQLTAEVFEVSTLAKEKSAVTDSDGRPEHEYVKDRKPKETDESNIFVIKQLGGGRKRKLEKVDVSDVPALSGGGKEESKQSQELAPAVEWEALERTEAEIKALQHEKKERKRLRKQQKKEKKMKGDRREAKNGETRPGEVESAEGNAVSAEEEEDKPFDYTTAPSVLHAKAPVPDRSGRRKAFNPYAKSADTAKGMPRSQKEMPGKSATFRR